MKKGQVLVERPPRAHAGTWDRMPPAEVVAGQKQHQSTGEIKDLEILHPAPAACVLPVCFGEAGEPANAMDIGKRTSPVSNYVP